LTADPIHLFADDGFDAVEDAEAKRQKAVNAHHQLVDITCARQEPSVTADVALRGFFRGPREEVRKTHRRGRHVTLKAMSA
jgi:hypothetical protein